LGINISTQPAAAFFCAFEPAKIIIFNMSPILMNARVVPPTRTNPTIPRLIGTVDIDGMGTAHPLAEVDPFILLDMAKINKNAMPPFGAHPHFGHSVATILLAGEVSSQDLSEELLT